MRLYPQKNCQLELQEIEKWDEMKKDSYFVKWQIMITGIINYLLIINQYYTVSVLWLSEAYM